LLILHVFLRRRFSGPTRQALDFSGPAAQARPDFNKVIHTIAGVEANEFQINDLAVFCKARLQLRLPVR
jgi:hypothetical protein